MRLASLVISAFLLAGCAAGGPLGPVPPLAPAVIEGEAISGPAGARLAVSTWEPEGAPRAVILAVHGFGSYGPSTFAAAAEYWSARGIRTVAYDQRGFGRNDSRASWPGSAALIDDLSAVAQAVRAEAGCLPVTVIGHSMGGGVVMAAAGEHRLDADQIVLAAPAIWGGDRLNPIHRAAAWLAAAWVPEKRFTGEGVVRIQASDNIDYLRSLARDPDYLARPSAREMLGLVRLMDRAEAAAASVDLPAILLLGAKDEVVEETEIRAVFDTVPGAHRVIRYDEGWHLLFNDLRAETVWSDVAEAALAAPPRCGASG